MKKYIIMYIFLFIMNYDSPGKADMLGDELLLKWNQTIQSAYEQLQRTLGSRFFAIDPATLGTAIPASVQWFADPAEPAFCIDKKAAQQLSDWGARGRQVLHNEYCEYRIIERTDANGRMRPKRVQVTTELREYWVSIAMHAPDTLRDLAKSILGTQPSWEELYGVSDPFQLSVEEREITFSEQVAGNGGHEHLKNAGVPSQPRGRLNKDNALFMTHPINGLDDLLYIVMFGAKPYARLTSAGREKATQEQIFRAFNVEQLACRHADPAAAMGAYGAAFDGRTVAFVNPLGMYILSFTKGVFIYQDEVVPDSWIRWSRGQQEGMYQRLEFGPGDDEPAFLDDIIVEVGNSQEPLRGGFQLLQQIEVGPLVVVGGSTHISDEEYSILQTSDSPIQCMDAEICNSIRRLKQEYDDAHQRIWIAPRRIGWEARE